MRVIVTVICLIYLFPLYSAPESRVIPYWELSDELSDRQIDHSLWSIFLSTYVKKRDGMNLVDYSKVSPYDYRKLEHYIEELEKVRVTTLNRAEQFVYWINLYNALTVKVIVDNYPIKSIKRIKPSGIFSFGPWDEEFLNIEGRKISLNSIEHGILRPIWQDYRVHYAVNCASLGCPPLIDRAFTRENAESLLKSAEVYFLNSSYGVQLEGDTLILSSIFNWFLKDFSTSEEGLLRYIEEINPSIKGKYKRIRYSYNWDLNNY